MPTAHLEIRRGTHKEASDYCKKDGSFQEIGVLPMSQEDKGHASKDIWHECHSLAKQGKLDEIPSKYYIRYKRTFDEIAREARFKRSRTDLITVLRPWQQHLVDSLDVDPNDRTVIWYVDSKGNAGKSKMRDYLVAHKQALNLAPAPYIDMAYLIEPAPLVVVDIPRNYSLEYFPYHLLEEIKNGSVTSTKYQPLTKNIPKCHVLVFSNFHPNRQRLSEDRWDIRVIENDSAVRPSQTSPPAGRVEESALGSVSYDYFPQVSGSVLQASQAAQYNDS